MNGKKICIGLLFVFWCLSISDWVSAQSPAKKKNVLFLIADDLNCDLHCYGHSMVRTPNIDRLAQRGVRFERAYCQYPLCSPSRTSLMTGRRPNETKIVTNPKAGTQASDYVPTPHFRESIPDTVTLSELFKNNGYTAMRVGKIYHYGVPGQIGTSGLDDLKSWNFVVNPAGRDKAEESRVFSLTPGTFGGSLSWHASEGTDQEQTDGLTATAAISLLQKYKDQPFFLAVGFFRPHTPYVAPRSYFAMYPKEKIQLPQLSADDQKRTPALAYGSAKKEQDTMTDDQRREAMQAYWGSISFMDKQLGLVVDELDRLGLNQNTLIIMTSDHGYHMYEHGLWQKMSLFENSARIPLIIVDPSSKERGKVTRSIVELVDLYPTIAELCGLSAPSYIDGQSIRPILENSSATIKKYAFTQIKQGNREGYSVRSDRWRMTQWNGGMAGVQLFDMENDSSEQHNLADSSDPTIQRVAEELRAELREYAR